MSAAGLAAAKKRRAGNSITNDINNVSSIPLGNKQNATTNGLPLQTIISTFNTRLNKLESNSKNTLIEPSTLTNEEYETRFNLLVDEISDLKEMILKLQSFTMEVNKSLFDERIKVLSAESIINNSIDNNDDDEEEEEDNDDEDQDDIDKIKETVENIKLDS